MYKLATFLCLIFVANTTFAQDQSQQPYEVKKFITVQDCAPVQEITKIAMFEFGEQPLFYATGAQTAAQIDQSIWSDMMFFVNQDSGTWSLVSRYEDGMGCIVASGGQFTPYTGPSDLVQRD